MQDDHLTEEKCKIISFMDTGFLGKFSHILYVNWPSKFWYAKVCLFFTAIQIEDKAVKLNWEWWAHKTQQCAVSHDQIIVKTRFTHMPRFSPTTQWNREGIAWAPPLLTSSSITRFGFLQRCSLFISHVGVTWQPPDSEPKNWISSRRLTWNMKILQGYDG